MTRCETTRDQYGTGSSFIDFDREQGSNVFVAQRHLTEGAVLSAIGDTDVPGDVRNTATDLCTTSPPWEEIMKKCLVVPLVGLAISFALPTYAQQKDLADPQTTQKILALIEALNEAQNNNDAAAIAAFFTRDGVFVTLEGPIIGRQAIQKWFTDLYQWWHAKNSIHKVDGNVVHSIGTTGNELWATGEWSETGQGKTGEPIPIKGYWFFIFVHEADDWKVRVTGGNVTPDCYILINKSFVLQPAATPSPTASPGTLPTYARQRDLADPQTTQELNVSMKGYFEARDRNDAAAVAAYYTRDAVVLTPNGPLIGREAIQKWYADMFQYLGLHPKKLTYKLDGNAYHLIGTAGNQLWCTGEWSDTRTRGYDADIFVREGDGWKLRVNAWNIARDSAVAQPAATPSSTASPGGQ